VRARKLWLHVRDKFSGEDSFQTVADTLRDSNVEEHSRVQTTGNTEVCSKEIK
jgi:hypothetical protein